MESTLTRDFLVCRSYPKETLREILLNFGERMLAVFLCALWLPTFHVYAYIKIKLTSKGPVFFIDWREGKYGKMIPVIKYRTMVDTPPAKHFTCSVAHRISESDKILPYGRTWRKRGWDEIPQLINIARGEMSFFGPRPPIFGTSQGLGNNYVPREKGILPGVIGLEQTSPLRDNPDYKTMYHLDWLYYRKRKSWRFKLYLIRRTYSFIKKEKVSW